ncbi:MAG: hypothetical protein JRH06_02215 [Deltaproteobacteria bacterium]|nr:hypothetical protein [Deltaproteobacteria bacterium]
MIEVASRICNRKGRACLCLTVVFSFLFFWSKGLCYDFELWDHGPTGHDTVLIHAELDERPLFLYFHVKGDKLCERMDRAYLQASQVENYLRDLYKVELDPTRGEDEKALAQRYGVKNYPAFLMTIPAFKIKPVRVHPFFKDRDMSIDEFLQAIRNKIAFMYGKKAFSFYEARQYDGALKYYRMILDYSPGDVYAYYAMGVVYHTMGVELKERKYLKEAEKMLMKALDIEPGHKESREELAKLRSRH